MNKFLFFIDRLFKMDYNRFFNTFKQIKNESNKPYIWLIYDMLVCAVKYNAGYMDYKIARMYRLNKVQRNTTITRGISNNIVRKMNNKDYWRYFDNKATFNTIFASNINRRWYSVSQTCNLEELKVFLNNQEAILYKPLEGSSGQGIYKIYSNEWQNNISTFFENVKSKGAAILEEIIRQHPKMKELNPSSVNTIRISTLLGDKKQGIVYAFLRIGNGKVIDNVDCGGMAARVDLDTGKLLTIGADKQGNLFEKHPITGVKIIGFEIPFWEQAKDICLKASQKIPQMRFIAWDVAITENGPVFIEGNSFPSHAVPQFAAHYPDGIGILREFREFIDI